MNEPLIKNRHSQCVIKNGHLLNVQPKGRYKAEGAGQRGMYEDGGAGRHNQDQDNGETHELLVTPAGVYYLLASPRLAEAQDSRKVTPLTGSDRSAPKPLTSTNHLYSQHQSNDQHKDVENRTSSRPSSPSSPS